MTASPHASEQEPALLVSEGSAENSDFMGLVSNKALGQIPKRRPTGKGGPSQGPLRVFPRDGQDFQNATHKSQSEEGGRRARQATNKARTLAQDEVHQNVLQTPADGLQLL